LTFQIESQNFCGQVTNTSVTGAIRIYRDSGFTTPTTTFSPNANIYVWVKKFIENSKIDSKISVESAFVVALVEVTAISVNNMTYPIYGVSGETQVSYGIKFAMLALTPPFQFGNNELAFSVRLTYGA
jgi:hypothetical protein